MGPIETAQARVDAGLSIIPDANENASPVFENPFVGLPFFAANALFGGAAIEAEAAKPIEYFWKPIASEGQIVMVAGPSGGGKTTLTSILIAARANIGAAIDVLGYPVTPSPARKFIIFVEAEHGKPSAARKLVKAMRLAGVDLKSLDRIIVLARSKLQMGTDAWFEMERLVAADLVSDIILDTLPQVAPGEANDEKMQAEIMRGLVAIIELAPNLKPVVWPIVHTRKSGADALEDVSGSVQRIGGADTVLLVNPERIDGRVVSSKVTFVKLREDPDPEPWPAPVSFAIEGGRIRLDNPNVRDERPMEQRVLSALEVGPKTKNELKTALHTSGDVVELAITNLFATHHLTTGPEKMLRGRTYKTFAIRVSQ